MKSTQRSKNWLWSIVLLWRSGPEGGCVECRCSAWASLDPLPNCKCTHTATLAWESYGNQGLRLLRNEGQDHPTWRSTTTCPEDSYGWGHLEWTAEEGSKVYTPAADLEPRAARELLFIPHPPSLTCPSGGAVHRSCGEAGPQTQMEKWLCAVLRGGFWKPWEWTARIPLPGTIYPAACINSLRLLPVQDASQSSHWVPRFSWPPASQRSSTVGKPELVHSCPMGSCTAVWSCSTGSSFLFPHPSLWSGLCQNLRHPLPTALPFYPAQAFPQSLTHLTLYGFLLSRTPELLYNIQF